MDLKALLSAVASGEVSAEEAEVLMDQKPVKEVSFEVSPKGAVKIKGIRARWPIVLYPNEIRIIAGKMVELEAFMEANKEKLSFAKNKEEVADSVSVRGSPTPSDRNMSVKARQRVERSIARRVNINK